ncbi:MAG: DUF2249 domain-containing protein [Ignavibacteriales bacterium]|nr:DUF2249 domain-containing protein [Ignavibacteriales bacterium]
MITKEWKVDAVLSACPVALEVFVAASPHFNKLKNALLRRALAPRVTVEQAAAIGGVRLDALLASLNEAAGFHEQDGKESRDVGSEPAVAGSSVDINPDAPVPDLDEILLDVRPIIQRGSDPLKTIMGAVRGLKKGQALHLINSFEPVPLYSVLGGKGYSHITKRIDGVWHIWFLSDRLNREGGSEENSDSRPAPFPASETIVGEKVIELDVRGLAPPEPMMRILETIGGMDGNEILLVHHHREPMMLYEKLEERGYEAVANRIEEHYYKVVIRKKVPVA